MKIKQNYIAERMRGYCEYGMGIIIILYSLIRIDKWLWCILGVILFAIGCWDLAKYSRIQEMKYE